MLNVLLLTKIISIYTKHEFEILLKQNSFLNNVCICIGLIMGAGDVASQVCVERKPLREFEYKRTLRFAFIGTCLVGPG